MNGGGIVILVDCRDAECPSTTRPARACSTRYNNNVFSRAQRYTSGDSFVLLFSCATPSCAKPYSVFLFLALIYFVKCSSSIIRFNLFVFAFYLSRVFCCAARLAAEQQGSQRLRASRIQLTNQLAQEQADHAAREVQLQQTITTFESPRTGLAQMHSQSVTNHHQLRVARSQGIWCVALEGPASSSTPHIGGQCRQCHAPVPVQYLPIQMELLPEMFERFRTGIE